MRRLIGDCAPEQLHTLLKTTGLSFAAGPFVLSVTSPMADLAASFRLLYGDYPLAAADDIVDFSVSIDAPTWVRRFVRPKFTATIDAHFPVQPVPRAHLPVMAEMSLNWMTATQPHGFMLFHSAVVERDGEAILMPGGSGHGKSTLCTSLVARGWRLFSDEFGLLDPTSGLFHPYPRPISLKNASIELVRSDAPHLVVSAPFEGTPKGAIAYVKPPASAIARMREPARCRLVLLPGFAEGAAPAATPLPPAELFLILTSSSVNYEKFGERGFEALSRLAAGTPAHRLAYADIAGAVRLVEGLL